MRVSREEVREVMERTRPRTVPTTGPSALLDQALVAVEQLTGDPVWDTFSQRIQAWLDAATGEIASLFKAIESSPTLSPDQLNAAHKQILSLRGRIDAWESVLRLPNEIKRMAEAKSHPPAA